MQIHSFNFTLNLCTFSTNDWSICILNSEPSTNLRLHNTCPTRQCNELCSLSGDHVISFELITISSKVYKPDAERGIRFFRNIETVCNQHLILYQFSEGSRYARENYYNCNGPKNLHVACDWRCMFSRVEGSLTGPSAVYLRGTPDGTQPGRLTVNTRSPNTK